MDKQKVIIDTDIGSDIDDALALLDALRSPELEILGVTTVRKNPAARARIAKTLLTAAGRDDIPVYVGCGTTIAGSEVDVRDIPRYYDSEFDEVEITDGADVGGGDGARAGSSRDAVDFIVESVLRYENQVTLVPVGNLTNVALAIIKHPEIKSRIRRIVWLGGSFAYHLVSWNAYLDPDAVRIVFESGVAILAVGKDATEDCVLRQEHIDAIVKSRLPEIQCLARLMERWHREAQRFPCLSDPVAIHAAFSDEFLAIQPRKVIVETRSEFTRGLVFVVNKEWTIPEYYRKRIPVVDAVCAMDSNGFINHFMARLLSE